MITVNMDEAKTRLTELVNIVEQGDEVVIFRKGKPIGRLSSVDSIPTPRNLEPDPNLRPILAPGYDPTEPLSEEKWREPGR